MRAGSRSGIWISESKSCAFPQTWDRSWLGSLLAHAYWPSLAVLRGHLQTSSIAFGFGTATPDGSWPPNFRWRVRAAGWHSPVTAEHLPPSAPAPSVPADP